MSSTQRFVKFISLSVLAGLVLAACSATAPAPVAPSPTAAPATVKAATVAPAAPVSVPTPVPTVEPTVVPTNLGAATFNHWSFNYDLTLAQQVTATTIPAQNPGTDAPDWAIVPAYDEFNFVGYPSRNTYHKPRIEIYAVDEFAAINPSVKDQIDRLKQLLSDAPAAPDKIPVLPVFNASQVFRSQIKYLNFQNGQGIRFVTQYDQAFIPINNLEVFYTFQGLTSDGRYYIAAILPVATNALPDTDQPSPEQQAAFNTAGGFEAYLGPVVQTLNGLPPTDFTPNLEQLDAMLQSLRAEK
jgi:hypothetical protein